MKRVQIKSTNGKDRNGRWYVHVHRNLYDSSARMNASGRRKRLAYTKAEVDYFFVLTGDRSIFIIPIEAAIGKFQLTLDRAYSEFRV